MLIAIASGKGGTGKTTVAANLALAVAGSEGTPEVTLLDCDVEEPNCHIFIKFQIESAREVDVPVPKVDEDKCTACGACGEICRFSAIISLKAKALTFPELCHACGGCALVCEPAAITEVPRNVGTLEKGRAGKVNFAHGRLRIGEAMSPPLIAEVKKERSKEGLTLVDCPPGTTCPVVEAVKGADYVVLVTEPTPFGMHDLKLAVDTMEELGLPMGVVVNRSDLGTDEVYAYCKSKNIPVLMEIPFDRKLAEAYSRGENAVDALEGYAERFLKLYQDLRKEASRED